MSAVSPMERISKKAKKSEEKIESETNFTNFSDFFRHHKNIDSQDAFKAMDRIEVSSSTKRVAEKVKEKKRKTNKRKVDFMDEKSSDEIETTVPESEGISEVLKSNKKCMNGGLESFHKEIEGLETTAEISLTTMKAVKSIISPKRPNPRSIRTGYSYISTVSCQPASKKYANLLSIPIDPRLPPSHSQSLNYLMCIDGVIEMYNSMRKKTLFHHICRTVLETHKVCITRENLKNILAVWKDAYKINWTRENPDEPWDFFLCIENNENDNSIQFSCRRNYYHTMLLVTPSPLPTCKLPSEPSTSNVSEISNLFSNTFQASNTATSSTAFSSSIYERVKEKEEAIRRDKEERTSRGNYSLEQLVEVSRMIKLHYANRKVSNQFLAQVVEKVYISKRGEALSSKSEVLRMVEFICSISKGWLSVVKSEGAQILRMTPSIQIDEIRQILSEGLSLGRTK